MAQTSSTMGMPTAAGHPHSTRKKYPATAPRVIELPWEKLTVPDTA